MLGSNHPRIADEPPATSSKPETLCSRWYSTGFKKFVAEFHGYKGGAYVVEESKGEKIPIYELFWNKIKEHGNSCWAEIPAKSAMSPM